MKPLWKTLLTVAVNAAIGAVAQYLTHSVEATVGAMAAGTAAAHLLESPLAKK